MDFTPRLGLPYMAAQQAQKQVTYNEAMKALDQLIQLSAKSRTTTAPPGSPAVGDTYIVPASATGGWAGKDHKIAIYIDGAWSFRDAATGWLAYVVDAAEIVIFGGSTWSQFVTNGGTSVAKFGINATADLTNRLSVAAAGTLFSHDGTDHRMKVNKSAAGSTASLLFQDAFSGRAEFGLTGDDDFHVKVSPDGSAWTNAVTIARTSGLVTLSVGQLAFPATQNPSSNANTLDDYEEGTWTPAIAFGGGSTGITYGAARYGRYIKVGKLVTLFGRLTLTAKGTSTGGAVISGVPFAEAQIGVFHVGYHAGMLGLHSQIIGYLNASTLVLHTGSPTAVVALTDANFTNSSDLIFSATYEASA